MADLDKFAIESLRAHRAAEWDDPRHPNCCPRCGWHVTSHPVSSYGLDCPGGVSPANAAGHLPGQRNGKCNGSERCRSQPHVHGCLGDDGFCDDPAHHWGKDVVTPGGDAPVGEIPSIDLPGMWEQSDLEGGWADTAKDAEVKFEITDMNPRALRTLVGEDEPMAALHEIRTNATSPSSHMPPEGFDAAWDVATKPHRDATDILGRQLAETRERMKAYRDVGHVNSQMVAVGILVEKRLRKQLKIGGYVELGLLTALAGAVAWGWRRGR